jgi:exonuclease III
LNDKEKMVQVRKNIAMHHPHIVTLQETKMAHMDAQLLKQTVGATYDAYLHNEAQGTT